MPKSHSTEVMQEASLSYAARPHVLIVDDDERIRRLISRFLTENGFVAVCARDAPDARRCMEEAAFDILVVDVMMPGEDGLALTRSLRESSSLPVLLLTALGEAGDRIAGLESGADDYLAKPFEPRELLLRLNAILRRRPRAPDDLLPFRLGRWHCDLRREFLVSDAEEVMLTSVDAKLLRALASRAGETLSREELARMCGLDSGERTIDVQVTRLRKKIEEDPRAPRFLQTVRGQGYVLYTDPA